MIIHCEFSSLFYWANGLTPVQHHNASLLTMIKTLGCHVCNTVPGCEVFLFMLANDAHVGAISLITTTVKTLVGPSPLHCPSHSTTPGEWVFVGWRLDWINVNIFMTQAIITAQYSVLSFLLVQAPGVMIWVHGGRVYQHDFVSLHSDGLNGIQQTTYSPVTLYQS